ncbi:DUF2905 domain-containing protein [Thermogutta sp.]|uniref:DUF2905 domain-containing protein n=1 Tax=Thermogutta sp. TaxID=1962930 RepID=UPI0021DD7B33|nr:DUF2905 domain-containing protein [Thermogutta sp.]GIX01839.1 MAG: hypothetical protein KatS3mg112_0776 [Thermogutta sp.]
MDLSSVGKMLILLGLVVMVLGVILWLLHFVPLQVGRLPGDIHIRGERWSFYFPITTCILLSIVLTIVLNVVLRLMR